MERYYQYGRKIVHNMALYFSQGNKSYLDYYEAGIDGLNNALLSFRKDIKGWKQYLRASIKRAMIAIARSLILADYVVDDDMVTIHIQDIDVDHRLNLATLVTTLDAWDRGEPGLVDPSYFNYSGIRLPNMAVTMRGLYFQNKTMQDIANYLKVSRQRVDQIKQVSINALKTIPSFSIYWR